MSSPARRILHPGSIAMLIAGLLMFAGAVLPWVSTPFGNLSGMAGPGLWVLCGGAIALAGALLPFRRVALFHALVPGIAVGALVTWQAIRLIQLSAETGSWGKLLPGIGLVLSAGGAVLLLRAAFRIRATPPP